MLPRQSVTDVASSTGSSHNIVLMTPRDNRKCMNLHELYLGEVSLHLFRHLLKTPVLEVIQ